MAYRDRIDALKERRAALEEERDGIERAISRKNTLETELRETERAIDDARMLPKGAPIRLAIAKPCGVSWDTMIGDERIRFCGKCEKYVYQLSAITSGEARVLMRDKPDACVRFFQRADGTVITSDCPVGAQKEVWRFAAVGGSTLAVVAVASFMTSSIGSGMVGDSVSPVSVAALKDVKTHPDAYSDEVVRTSGTLVHGTHVHTGTGMNEWHYFNLMSDGVLLDVRYDGILPDSFVDAAGSPLPVMIEGRMKNGAFIADSVSARGAHQGYVMK